MNDCALTWPIGRADQYQSSDFKLDQSWYIWASRSWDGSAEWPLICQYVIEVNGDDQPMTTATAARRGCLQIESYTEPPIAGIQPLTM